MSRLVDFAKIQRVLIIRTDHLGDLLLSTPLIRELRSALPGRHFALVASPANVGALADWDALDEIFLFDPNWSRAKKWAFIEELRLQHWDLCLILSPRTPSYILGWLSGAPVRAGIVYSRRLVARLLTPLWLTHPVVISVDDKLAERQPIPHEVKQLAQIVATLGLPDREPGPLEFPLNPPNLDWADGWLEQQTGTGNRQNQLTLIGIHGAGKWLSRGWTATDFLLLVKAVASMAENLNVVLTFGPGDQLLETAVTQALQSQPDPRLLLPGPLPVSRWAALVSLCDAVVSPDTGSLHLAVAVGRPVVALYEADTFLHCSTQWAPWQVPHGIVRRGAPVTTIPIIVAELLRLVEQAK